MVVDIASALKEASAVANGQQQIIVIPQSLLQQSTSKNNKVQFKISPVRKEEKPTITKMTTVNASEILGQYVPKPSKRRMAPASPSHSMSSGYDSSSEDKGDSGTPVRKRANLDHLTPEEKLMRRKLKNRVAAQNARDKKRLRMEEMERLIQVLQEEKRHLRMENEKLLAMNRALASENEKLQTVKDEMPPSPDSLPRSPLSAGATTTAQGIVVPRPTSEPAVLRLPQRGSGRGMAVERSLAAALLLWACLMFPVGRTSYHSSQQRKISPLRISQMSKILQRKRLPLKKRNWLEQRSWTPAKT